LSYSPIGQGEPGTRFLSPGGRSGTRLGRKGLAGIEGGRWLPADVWPWLDGGGVRLAGRACPVCRTDRRHEERDPACQALEPLARFLSWLGTMELSFDRGTLVLQGADRNHPLPAATGLLWDERSGVFRAPALAYEELVASLAPLRTPWTDDVAPTLQSPLPLPRPALRDYQEQALAAWTLARRRGVVALPTGSGKTRVAHAALAEVSRPALVLVPTRALLAQWVQGLRDAGVDDVGVVGDGEHRLRPLTVCTFESAYRRMDTFGHRFALVVVDEAHHFGTGARSEALEMAVAPLRLGLTATPPTRAEDQERLRRLIGPVVCTWTVQELTGTSLAPFDHLRLFVELTARERTLYATLHEPYAEAVRALFRARPGATWADIARTLATDPRGAALLAGQQEAVRLVGQAQGKLELVEQLLQRHRDDRTLLFTAGNEEAYLLSRRLLIPAITCDIGRAERADLLDRLRRGLLRSLVSAQVLNEGIDVPEARVAVLCGGRQGEREQVQRAGRVLRPAPGKRALIYELVVRDTFEERQSERRRHALDPPRAARRNPP